MFKALVLEQQDGTVTPTLQQLSPEALPAGDVLVAVAYSSLNYKDGLAVTNRGKIVRSYPMVPGIDFAGTVVESHAPQYTPGDEVVLTGWGVGETHWGGLAQMARVKADWLVPLPKGLTMVQAMGIGTAGMTAMLSVMALEEHGMHPEGREVVVTGASGGVGSVAIAVLCQRGYAVVASTGKTHMYEYLREIGAHEFLSREDLAAPSKRPLESVRWGGAIDTVGGDTLAGVLRCLDYGCSAAVCGLAGGFHLNTTVMPFILRGVNILGIDSVSCPLPRRLEAWKRLSADLPCKYLNKMIQVVALDEVPRMADDITQGKLHGRIVVDVNA